jgi:trimeric autotransporter adhesin
MKTPYSKLGVAAAITLLGAIGVACGSSTSSGSVSAIALSPSPCGVARTSSVQMGAVATLSDGTKQDLGGRAVTWTTGNTSTATVSATGVVVGVNVGVTEITAAYQGATGSLNCTVGP